jgi:hypothetical protein
MDKSHIVQSNAKFLAVKPMLWVSVVFRSSDEIDDLIHALEMLRDNGGDPNAHFHLQNYDFNKDSPLEAAEILFHGPWYETSHDFKERPEMAACAREVLPIALRQRS